MGTKFYHYDGQGSTVYLTDEDANVTDSYAYTAFGESVDTGVENPTTNHFRYLGQQGYYLDTDTGDYYVRARMYRPTLARWLSQDPLEFKTLTAQGINRNCYVQNNPISWIDPTGMEAAAVVLEVNYIGFQSTMEPENLQCGRVIGAAWGFSFSGEKKAPCNGYLVQEVNVFCDIDTDCKKCPTEFSKKPKFSYYEAWHFTKGEENPDDQEGSVTDQASFEATDSWCGIYKQVTELRFYCEDSKQAPVKGTGQTGVLGWEKEQSYDGGDENCSTSALKAMSTKEKPGFWKDPAVAVSKRNFSLSWNCCPKCPNKEVKAEASPKGPKP